jgi:hypothetical protein
MLNCTGNTAANLQIREILFSRFVLSAWREEQNPHQLQL